LAEISSHKFSEDEESDYWSDLGRAEGKHPISLKQTEFSLTKFAKGMRPANYSAFNQWKKLWVAGLMRKKHRSIIWGQNHLEQHRDGPRYMETAVEDCLVKFKRLLRWIISTILNGFGRSGSSCVEGICELNSDGKEKGKARQKVTRDRFGIVHA